MFDADRPIVKSVQDRLSRTVFAKYLARCILDHKEPQSLVVGLYGGFGSGKTSLINLMLEEFEFAATTVADKAPTSIVLNFSPWSYSGQNQMIYSFFRRLSATLRAAPHLKNGERIIHLLEVYISFFTHKPVPRVYQLKQSLLKKWKTREDVYGWESGRDLTMVKAELNALLQQQPCKIIIVIDNIARLYDTEIKQIFQIIKSMGDYANTVYLLALDKEHVINAVNRIEGGGGVSLLEKIVQLSFDVPVISRQDLENIFLDKLNLVMKFVAVEEWDREAWTAVYYTSLRYFFDNCRDITRYVNALSFGYTRVKEVVNAVDFFSLTAIDVFFPEIYAGIRDNKDLFTDLVENAYQLDQVKLEQDRLRCEEILNRTSRRPRHVVLPLLFCLFPRIRKIYHPSDLFYYSALKAREYRHIACSDMFDAYFRLSLQTGYISNEEMTTILQLASNENSFTQALTRLNQDNRIIRFLDRLDPTMIASIPLDRIGNILNALLDNGDLFPEEENSLLRFNTPMHIYRITQQLLQRYKSADDRFSLLRHAILAATKSIYSIVHELQEMELEHVEASDRVMPVEYRLIMPDQLLVLKMLAVERVQFWINMNRLMEHPKLLPILYAWLAWGSKEECRQYVHKAVREDAGLLAFLCAAFREPINQATIKYERTFLWEKCLENVEAFILPEELEAQTKAIFESTDFERLREREQLALMIFLDVMQTETVKVIPRTA